MASRGSVIPLFLRQILSSQPISVTDPEMTRFMMTLDDAVDLVLHAFSNGLNGDIFVQKAPAATIDTLIKALLKITNKADYPVDIIGTRHGEKLFEALCSREEMFVALDQDNYYRIPSDNRDLNYSKYNEEGQKDLSKVEDYNSHNTTRLDVDQMVKLLHKLDFIVDIAAGSTDLPEGV
jgi:UDP-glucose 4-epimerase